MKLTYRVTFLFMLLFLLFGTNKLFAQQGFEQWNKNYKQVNLLEILKYEQ